MVEMDSDGDPVYPDGDDGGSVSFSDFTDEDADLSGMVDFLGIGGTILKSWVAGVFSILAGSWLAFSQAFGDIVESVTGYYTGVGDALISSFSEIQGAAVSSAAEGVVDFGLFSLPAGTFFVLVAIGASTVIIYVFIWGDE